MEFPAMFDETGDGYWCQQETYARNARKQTRKSIEMDGHGNSPCLRSKHFHPVPHLFNGGITNYLYLIFNYF
jgi:hypothetical protein